MKVGDFTLFGANVDIDPGGINFVYLINNRIRNFCIPGRFSIHFFQYAPPYYLVKNTNKYKILNIYTLINTINTVSFLYSKIKNMLHSLRNILEYIIPIHIMLMYYF